MNDRRKEFTDSVLRVEIEISCSTLGPFDEPAYRQEIVSGFCKGTADPFRRREKGLQLTQNDLFEPMSRYSAGRRT